MFNARRLAYNAGVLAIFAAAVGCGKAKAPPPGAEERGAAPPTVERGEDSYTPAEPKDGQGSPSESPTK